MRVLLFLCFLLVVKAAYDNSCGACIAGRSNCDCTDCALSYNALSCPRYSPIVDGNIPYAVNVYSQDFPRTQMVPRGATYAESQIMFMNNCSLFNLSYFAAGGCGILGCDTFQIRVTDLAGFENFRAGNQWLYYSVGSTSASTSCFSMAHGQVLDTKGGGIYVLAECTNSLPKGDCNIYFQVASTLFAPEQCIRRDCAVGCDSSKIRNGICDPVLLQLGLG